MRCKGKISKFKSYLKPSKQKEISKGKSDKKIAELQKKVKRLSSPSSSDTTRPTLPPPFPTNNFDSAAVSVPSDYDSSSSSSSAKHKPADKSSYRSTHKTTHKSTHKPHVYPHQTPIKSQVHHTVSTRCPTKTNDHQRAEVNTISVSTAPGSQLRGNTPSPDSGRSSPYTDGLMLSKGSISLMRFISHSQQSGTSHGQHSDNNVSIYTTKPKPIPKSLNV